MGPSIPGPVKALVLYFRKPFSFELLDRYLREPGVAVLDVGCGNHSPSKTKRYYPGCRYFGLDKGCYNNDEKDFSLMEEFYQYDLDAAALSLDVVPSNFFDVVIFSHVIEHLENGEEVISLLVTKLKPGGVSTWKPPRPKAPGYPA